EYQTIDFSKPQTSFELDANILLKTISQTTFAASDKEQRPVLMGVHVILKDHLLTCIATDSFRLSRKQMPLDTDVNTEITIPASTLNDIAKIVEKDEPITIATDGKKAQFYIDSYLVQTRLLDGSYPETDRLIPAEFKYEIEIGSRELVNAIDRGALFKNDGISIVKLVGNGNNLELSSQSQEVGSYMENIITSNVIGDGIKLSFSGKYVTDAIKALGCNVVKVQFSGEMKPFLIKDVEDETIMQLVLPVRTYN
ncbi:MAG: DNA polymerase III subunit beta, partial [Erysipelotrichaceae bacterium]|nr:DNA polymerase III subunit beta [Erysipelotrichaceae bacterium]